MIVIHRNPACFARQSASWQSFYPRTRSGDGSCHRFLFEYNHNSAENYQSTLTGCKSSQQDESFAKKEDVTAFEQAHHQVYVPAHIDEENEIVSISLDIPGFSINDLNVEIERSIIRMSGMRINKLGHKFSFGRHFLMKETLLDADHVMANLSDGILTISLPRKEEMKCRVVPITSNTSSLVNTNEEELKVASPEEDLAEDDENKQARTRSEACAILVETVEDGDEDPQFPVEHRKAMTSEKNSNLEPTVGESDHGAQDTTIDSDASVEDKAAWVDLNNERD
jgi:HSP20 family molecular chaperone IbpA